jgi:hypothetical protein
MKTWMLIVAILIAVVLGVWIMQRPGDGQKGQPTIPHQTTAPGVGTPVAPAPQQTPPAAAKAPDLPSPDKKVPQPAKPDISDAAKWSEGMSGMSAIASAMRAYYVEVGPKGRVPTSLDMIGLTPEDVNGKYFGPADYSIRVSSMDPLTFTVTCAAGSKPDAPLTPRKRMLSSDGQWSQD